MAIKWKNSYTLFVATFLLVIGSMMMLNNRGNNYDRVNKDYQLENELGPKFVLNYVEKLDEKKLSTDLVSSYLVDNYRYEYGDLESQVQDINSQYKGLLKAAKEKKEDKLVNTLTTERDEKLLDIISNYTSNEAVKKKIVKRDTERLLKAQPKAIKRLKNTDTTYVDDNYVYYFTGDDGFVVTNLGTKPLSRKEKDIKAAISKEKVLSVGKTAIWAPFPEELLEVTTLTESEVGGGFSMTGYVATRKGSDVAAINQKATQEEKKQDLIFMVGLAIFVVGGILALRFMWEPVYFSEQAAFIQRVPLDVRLLLLGLLGFIALITWQISPGLPIMSMGTVFFFLFAYGAIFCGLCLSKNIWLAIKKTEGYPDFPTQAKQSLLVRGNQKIRRLIGRLPVTLKLLFVLGYVLVVSLFSFFITVIGSAGEFALIIWTMMMLVVAVPLIMREYRLKKLLIRPQDILERNQEEAQPTEIWEDVSENLAHIDQIISTTHDNRQRSENLKTELLTNVSHDLRTPLTSIISYGDLLTKENLKEEDRQEYTAIINRKAMRMKNLIDDLFAVTKMNNGEIKLSKKTINLGQLLQQSIAEYGEEFTEKNLKLMYSKPEEPVMLAIDGDRMWRVFDNLIGNVIKYAMPQTRVYLKLEDLGHEVKVELKNVSLHELNENASSLVERFTRGDEARNTEGSGLGLAIANSIINLHGGRFDIVVDGDMFKIIIYLPK
ncbi:HAMP domain-containing sensor histidine kinase [uncultured Vagococcus sp.]|uniref:HAMP domain-containing sensor histidine kinase n=1 Tax=uncultured Vagococcus sp. TaxID=189676 RepID=UPI0028D53D3C|nr:HAMP domain-containing sensor histidine kinase [uncultured Vagococcus sp.]